MYVITGENWVSIGMALPVRSSAYRLRLSGHSSNRMPTCGVSVGSFTTQFHGSWSALTPSGGGPCVQTTGPDAIGTPSCRASTTGAHPYPN